MLQARRESEQTQLNLSRAQLQQEREQVEQKVASLRLLQWERTLVERSDGATETLMASLREERTGLRTLREKLQEDRMLVEEQRNQLEQERVRVSGYILSCIYFDLHHLSKHLVVDWG